MITTKIYKCENGVKHDINHLMIDVKIELDGYFQFQSPVAITLYCMFSMGVITTIICRCEPKSATYIMALFELLWLENK